MTSTGSIVVTLTKSQRALVDAIESVPGATARVSAEASTNRPTTVTVRGQWEPERVDYCGCCGESGWEPRCAVVAEWRGGEYVGGAIGHGLATRKRSLSQLHARVVEARELRGA